MPDVPPPVPAIEFALASRGMSKGLAQTTGPQALVRGELAIGRRERSGGVDYTAWNAGLAWSPEKHFTVDLRYYDTEGGDAQPFRARAVASARVKF